MPVPTGAPPRSDCLAKFLKMLRIGRHAREGMIAVDDDRCTLRP
jgi:hypothetical protein